ncbi:hypothetical protein M885DRAFT_531521, partial [Pelagophyceae sp. CCMP2097]
MKGRSERRQRFREATGLTPGELGYNYARDYGRQLPRQPESAWSSGDRPPVAGQTPRVRREQVARFHGS